MAVATSNQRDICEDSLTGCGIRPFFNHLVCVADVRNAKPAPDPYLLAAAKLGQNPRDCWALEDSDIGTRAAHGAGMRTFQIPDARPPVALCWLLAMRCWKVRGSCWRCCSSQGSL